MTIRTIWTIGIATAAAVSPAAAADMQVKATPAAVVSWAGPYVGGSVGYGWARVVTDHDLTTVHSTVVPGPPNPVITTTTASNTTTAAVSGAAAGLQAGFNWQDGHRLLGIEGDLQVTGQRGGSSFASNSLPGLLIGNVPVTIPIVDSVNYKLPWFATLRGRVGHVVDAWLLYLTAGLSVGQIDASSTMAIDGVTLDSGKTRLTRLGWVVGGGAEMAVGRGWTLKLEYLYLDFGGADRTTSAGPVTSIIIPATITTTASAAHHIRFADNILRVGLNYRLGDIAR